MTNSEREATTSKIIVGLERISEAFKVLLWEKAKEHGISPIQIQLLLFISEHGEDLNKVSSLAREFNLTKPTISDAIKVLHTKGLITKDISSEDSRSYSIFISSAGDKLVKDLQTLASPFHQILDQFEQEELSQLYQQVTKLVYQLNKSKVLEVQRTCLGCQFFDHINGKSYCNYLNLPLQPEEIRLDCHEFVSKA